MSSQSPGDPQQNPFERPPLTSRNWMWFQTRLGEARSTWFSIARQIPDLLTGLRLVLALILFGLGLIDEQASPARDIWLLVIGWTTDMADGRISRSLKKEHRMVGLRLAWPAGWVRNYDLVRGFVVSQKLRNTSWLGQHDVYVDMFVSIAALGYLAVTGLLPFWLALTYLTLWGIVFMRRGIPELFAQIFQNPIYAAFVFFAVRSEPGILPWLLLWALIALVFFWRRLVQLLEKAYRTVRRQ